MSYLLVWKDGARIYRTRWLTDAHHENIRKRRLVIVDMKTERRLDHAGWRFITPRRGEPRVVLVDDSQDDFWGWWDDF